MSQFYKHFALSAFLSLFLIAGLLIIFHNQLFTNKIPVSATAAAPIVTETKQFKAFQVVNQDGSSNFTDSSSKAWVGTGNSTSTSYLGLHFKDVFIPSGAVIKDAYIKMVSKSNTSKKISGTISVENATSAVLFSKTLLPSKRTLVLPKVSYTDTSAWKSGFVYRLPSATDTVKKVVVPGTTQNINVIIQGTGHASEKRDIYSTSDSTKVPLLVVTYDLAPQNPNYPKTINVLEVRYFPNGQSAALYQPDTLSTELKKSIMDGSSFHKYSNIGAQPSLTVQTVSVHDRLKYRPNPDGTWYSSTQAILADENLCQEISDKKVDEVWVWADPSENIPGQEYVISSKNFQDPEKIKTVTYADPLFCGGQYGFTFFEFSYSNPSDFALHSFGHFLEGLLSNVQTQDLFWKDYTGDPANGSPRTNKCGNVHFPPNGAVDYDYANTTSVTSSCDDWKPDLSGATKTFTCQEWGCKQDTYLKWWMQNMPNMDNTLTYQGKKLPNWWDFVKDMDTAINTYSADTTYFFNRNLTTPNETIKEVTTVSHKKQDAGTTLSWIHTIQGTNPLLVVTAAYRAHNNPSAHLNTVTYQGLPLTFVRRDTSSDRNTEIWYLTNPPLGDGTVNAEFSLDPEAQSLSGITVTNVNTANPISANGGNSENILDGTIPGSQSVTVSAAAGNLVLGVLSTYPDGTSNTITPVSGTEKLWSVLTDNKHIQESGAARYSQDPSTILQWTSAKAYSWSASAIGVNLLP